MGMCGLCTNIHATESVLIRKNQPRERERERETEGGRAPFSIHSFFIHSSNSSYTSLFFLCCSFHPLVSRT